MGNPDGFPGQGVGWAPATVSTAPAQAVACAVIRGAVELAARYSVGTSLGHLFGHLFGRGQDDVALGDDLALADLQQALWPPAPPGGDALATQAVIFGQPTKRHTWGNPGPQSHGSSLPSRRAGRKNRKDPKTAGLPKGNPRGGAEMRRGTPLAVVGAVLLGGLIVTTGGAQVVGAVASSEQELDGVWESVERSRGGIGTSYEFKATGTVCVSPGAMVDFDYQLEGNTVTITSAESGEQPVMTMVLDPEQDLLIPQGVGSEAQLPMERVSGRGAGEGSVVGTWKPTETESDSDLPEEARQGELAIRKNARQTFTADGRVLLRIPFRTDCGSYTVIGNKLTLVIVGQTSKMDFRLEGDTLILVSPEGAEGVFRRREGVVNSPTREEAASANPLESEDPPTCV